MRHRIWFIPAKVVCPECPDPELDVKVDANFAPGLGTLPDGWTQQSIANGAEFLIVTTNITPSVEDTAVVVFGGVVIYPSTGASGIIRLYLNGVLKDTEAVASEVYETISLVGGTENMGTGSYAIELKIYNNSGSTKDFYICGGSIAGYSVE